MLHINCTRQREEGKLFQSKSPNPTAMVESPITAENGESSLLGDFTEHHNLGAESASSAEPCAMGLLCNPLRAMLPGVTGKEEVPAAFTHLPCTASLHTSDTGSRQTRRAGFRGDAEETVFAIQ